MGRRAALSSVIGMAALALAACSATGGGAGLGDANAAGGPTVPPGVTLDAGAQKAAREAEFRALESGKTGVPVSWQKGSFSGEVTPGAKYQVNTFNCRDFTQTVVAGGQRLSTRATACRQQDGSWQTVN